MRLIEEGRFWDNLNDELEMGVTDISEAVKNALDNTPTVDGKPVVHAHWIDTGNSFEDGQCRYNYWECSHCHKQIAGRYGLPDYCPNCGARMDLG